MEIIIGGNLPYYYEQDFYQALLWYEKVHISQLVYVHLSMGKMNIGPILHPLEERGLLQVVDDPTSLPRLTGNKIDIRLD